MKAKTLQMSALVALSTGLYAFTWYANMSPQHLTLENAIKEKLVHVKATTANGHGEKSVQLELINLTTHPLALTVPHGLVFHPIDPDQDLMVVNDQKITLASKGTTTQLLDAFCIEAGDASPASNQKLTFDMTKHARLKELTDYMNGKELDANAKQTALWVVSDGNSISGIDNATPPEAALRTYLAKLTQQEDPWYTAKKNYVVQPSRRISFEPTTVTGKISLQSDGNLKMRQVIETARGEVKKELKEMSFPEKGGWNYRFHITVQGWEEGDYVVKLVKGTEVIKSVPFTI